MNPLFPNDRRIEQLERGLSELQTAFQALSREPQGFGKRWLYWGVTSLPYGGGTYPGDGTNTFPFRTVDPTFTKAAGTRALTTPFKQVLRRFIGRSSNGQWIAPGELVTIAPLPPPPGTTSKGRWLIIPSKTYYEGFLLTDLHPGGSAIASVYRQTSPGAWTNLGYPQTVRDSGFLQFGRSLRAGTWVRYEWETTAWVVTGPACISCEEQTSGDQTSVQTSEEQTSQEQTSQEQASRPDPVCCESTPTTLYLSIDQFDRGPLLLQPSNTPVDDPDFCVDGEFVISDLPSTSPGHWEYHVGGVGDPGTYVPGTGDTCYLLNCSIGCVDNVYDFRQFAKKFMNCSSGDAGNDNMRCQLTFGSDCVDLVPLEVIAQSCEPYYFEAIVTFCAARFSSALGGTVRTSGTCRIRIHE